MNDCVDYDVKDNSIQNFAWIGLKKLFRENKLFDISIVASNGVVSAHKLILVSFSTYLELLLTSTNFSTNPDHIDLTLYDIEIICQLINFMYTGKIKLTHKNILKLVELEDFLGVNVLRHHLMYYMLETLNDTNCWQYHSISEKHNYREVFDKSDRYIRTHFTKLISGKKTDYLNVPPFQLLSILEGDFLGVSDHELFLISLCDWIAYAPEARLEHLEALLSKVDVARIPSWRGMVDKLSACFPTDYQNPIKEWALIIQSQRDSIEKKAPLKETLLEVVFLVGGVTRGDSVAYTDVFIPPMVLLRILPVSTDHRQLVVLPAMHEPRVKPTVVSTPTSVYVIGGTSNHEELKADGIPCEVYKIKDNKWCVLPSLPHNDKIIFSTNRRPPAAYVNGNLYAALPSPMPSVWILQKNESCWSLCTPPDCYEIFDLVALSGSLYCIGKEFKDSACYVLDRYDSFSFSWCRISVFTLSSSRPEVKALCLENILCVTSGEQWLRFDPHKSAWKKCQLAVCCGEVLPSLCTYKDKQIVSLRSQEGDNLSQPVLELVSANGSSEFFVPGRTSAGVASVLIPLVKPPPI